MYTAVPDSKINDGVNFKDTKGKKRKRGFYTNQHEVSLVNGCVGRTPLFTASENGHGRRRRKYLGRVQALLLASTHELRWWWYRRKRRWTLGTSAGASDA